MAKSRRARNSPFDWVLVDSLAGLRASEAYLAERILVGEARQVTAKNVTATIKWVQRHIKAEWGMSYVQYCDKKEEHFRLGLKQTAREVALKSKNVTMIIWLTKQYLGYTDKVDQKLDDKTSRPGLVIFETSLGSSSADPSSETQTIRPSPWSEETTSK